MTAQMCSVNVNIDYKGLQINTSDSVSGFLDYNLSFYWLILPRGNCYLLILKSDRNIVRMEKDLYSIAIFSLNTWKRLSTYFPE